MESNSEDINRLVTIFDMDLDTEEDVDACLAEFAFLARLDAREEARQLAEHVLWSHIEFFPIFAELSAFFILIQDSQAVSDLIVDLAVRRITFNELDQQDYVQMVALFARGRLSNSTLTAFSRESGLEPGDIKPDTTYCLFHNINYTSVAQIQNIEMRVYDILAGKRHQELPDVLEFATGHIQELVDRGLLRAATEILSIICMYLHNVGQKYDIWNLYTSLRDGLAQRLKNSTTSNDMKDVLLMQTSAKTSLFVTLRGNIQYPPAADLVEDSEELIQDIERSTSMLFAMIANKEPMEPLLDRLQTSRRLSQRPPHLEQSPSRVQGRVDLPKAVHSEHAQRQASRDIHILDCTGKVLISQPRGLVKILGSKEEVYVAGPKESVHVQNPQHETYVQSPERETYVQLPEAQVYVQRPQKETYIQDPGKETFVQGSREKTYVQCPEQETYVQQSQGPVYVQFPENETNIIQSQGPVRIYEPKDEVYIYGPSASVFLYGSTDKIRIYGAKEDILIHEPRSDVHIHTPNSPVHLYGLDTRIVHAEEEPLPTYTADYTIPDIIPLKQSLNKPQMVVTLENVVESVSQTLHEVEKLDHKAREYTSSTSIKPYNSIVFSGDMQYNLHLT